MVEVTPKGVDIWGQGEEQAALIQVAELCRKAFSLPVEHSNDRCSFHSLKKSGRKKAKGILSLSGNLADNARIAMRIELVRSPRNLRVASGAFFNHLANLGDRVSLLPPKKEKSGETSLQVTLKVKASPMCMTRENVFLDQLKQLDDLASLLQAELPVFKTHTDLAKQYKEFENTLLPIEPLEKSAFLSSDELRAWSREILEYLQGATPVALVSPFLVTLDFALAVLSRINMETGASMGQIILPALGAKGLLELAGKAPGIVVVPAVRMRLGTSPYELGNEMQSLLSALSSANRQTIFTGTMEELQAIFSGGQGGRNDPLFPIVCHVPDVPLDLLAPFVVEMAGREVGGLPASSQKALVQETLDALKFLHSGDQKRLLPMTARRGVNNWHKGHKEPLSQSVFVSRASGLSETLAGLNAGPRVKRLPNIQDHFVSRMCDSGLLPYLKEHLLAQDDALKQQVNRLRMEVLTRPSYQPIRYCAQGTPGTGKSESAVLLAKWLDIPYVNIDAASMPDYHTASSQLLGSGVGIVMSHQAGRMEQMGKHHTGVLVDVSDLDHAVPIVRAPLADLFLQTLETGEAQSATGAMFSCASVIFAFTMNLPDGADESVRKGIGFHNTPTREEVLKRVLSEFKTLLSSAFLSRIGTPILFEPLDGDTLATILERAMKKAILSGTERLHTPVREVVMEEGLGAELMAQLKTGIASFGARALLEYGRSLAAKAIVDLVQKNGNIRGKSLHVSPASKGQVVITANR
jgi:hypothetical protein